MVALFFEKLSRVADSLSRRRAAPHRRYPEDQTTSVKAVQEQRAVVDAYPLEPGEALAALARSVDALPAARAMAASSFSLNVC